MCLILSSVGRPLTSVHKIPSLPFSAHCKDLQRRANNWNGRSGLLYRQIGPKKLIFAFSNGPGAAEVVLTRERGKNGELKLMLDSHGVKAIEVPLVETTEGPDRNQLPGVLKQQAFAWITITSPEAAAVFLEAWVATGKPKVNIAVVGQGTGRILTEAELPVKFTPSKANAVHLAAELPLNGSDCSVLYPASARAGSDLQDGLQARGFNVTRLNTYDTQPVKELDAATLSEAKQAAVIAIASPSALKAWVQFAGQQHASHMATACIGSTSAGAARKLGLQHVFYPDKPGLKGFVASILEALQAAQTSPVTA